MSLEYMKDKYIAAAEISTGIVLIAVVINKTAKISLGIKPEPIEVVKAAIFLTAGQIISLKLLYTALDQ